MLKKFVKNLLPYGFVKSRQNRLFAQNNVTFCVDIDKDIKKEAIAFDTILSIQGFGYSGHTALVNLFQEYKSIKECTNTTVAGESSYEIDFMRLGGGVMDFEKYLSSFNIFQNDAAFHRLLKQMGACTIFKENKRCKELADLYLSSLIDMKLENLSAVYYNGAIADNDTSIYYIKNMTVHEFRKKTQEFLTALFNVFYAPDKRVLMLDHFFTDYEWDMQKYTQYVPPLKVIALYRDPRDVYFYANQKNVEWIPHNNVHEFIKWCGKTYGKFNINATEYYPIRFEDLVLDYDNTVEKLEEYVGLDPNAHVDKFKFLNPEKSKINIGIWRQAPELKSDMDLILSEMPSLCHKEKN